MLKDNAAFVERNHREPTREQLEEERKFASRLPERPRTTTGETTRVVNLANAAIESATARTRGLRDTVKSLKAQTAEAQQRFEAYKNKG